MKVLLIAAKSDIAQANLILRLAGEGVEAEVICDPSDRWAAAFREAGLRVTGHVFCGRIDPAGIRLIRGRLRGSGCQLAHAFTSRALASALLACAGLPVRLVAYRGTMGHLRYWNPASWLAYLNPRVDRILCVSEAVRQYLLHKRVSPARAVTIYKGHDPAWYAGLPRPSLAEFGIPAGAVTVAFAGSMRAVKGVDVLLEAVPLVPPFPPVHVLLVGDVRDRRIRSLARRPGAAERVHFAGFRPDAPAIAGAADIFVMPSVEREGLPRAVLEAMAQGVPPVVTAVGGMPELVIDGDSGLVVPPRDPHALAAAIARLASDPALRRRLGAAARRRIATDFHIDRTVLQTVAVYRGLVEGRGFDAARTRLAQGQP